MSTSAALIRGDAVRLPLRAESVDLIVTSPPYFALRSYRDGGEHYDGQIGSEETPQAFLEALWAVTAECWRVLKPTGSLFVNLGDKYAGSGGHNNSGVSKSKGSSSGLEGGKQYSHRPIAREFVGGGGGQRRAEQREASRRNAPDAYNKSTIGGARPKSLMGLPWRYALGCIDQLGLILRAEIIWAKPNGLPESAADRVSRRHEQWFHFTEQGQYHASLDELRVPQQSLGRGRPLSTDVEGSVPTWGTETGTQSLKGKRTTDQMNALHPLGTLPGSVWTIPSEPLCVPDYLDVDHFAAFPQEWPRRLILGWSPADGVVLDPFAGTGTVPMVARSLGRYGIGLDLSADYLRLAHWRVFESGHASKSIRRTNEEQQGALI